MTTGRNLDHQNQHRQKTSRVHARHDRRSPNWKKFQHGTAKTGTFTEMRKFEKMKPKPSKKDETKLETTREVTKRTKTKGIKAALIPTILEAEYKDSTETTTEREPKDQQKTTETTTESKTQEQSS